MKFPITNQTQIRDMFWNEYPEFKRVPGRKQNQYPADVRVSFCDFIERLNRSQSISELLAQRATL